MPGIHIFPDAWATMLRWVCPAPLPGKAGTVKDVQRQRISRFLPAILLIGLASNGANVADFLSHGVTYALAEMLLPLPLVWVCLYLCHRRWALAAAWCYIGSTFLAVLVYNLMIFDRAHYLQALVSITTFVPLCAIAILISLRACWIALALLCTVSTVVGMVAFGATLGLLGTFLTIDGLLIGGTAVVALGAHGLHRALREADRSQELAALNAQLASYNAQIIQREAETQHQRRFVDAVLHGVAPDALFVLDPQGIIVRCNAAFETIFGFASGAAVGWNIVNLPGAPPDYAAQMRHMRQGLREHRQVRTETTFTLPTGRSFIMESHAVALAELGISVVIARDISARLAMEGRLRHTLMMSDHNRALLSTVFDTVQDALVVFDATGRIVLRNAGFRALFPGTATATTGTLPRVAVQALDGTLLLPRQWPHLRVLRGETVENPQVLRVKIADQPQRMLALNCVPLQGADGRCDGVLLDLRDVTQELRQRRNIEAMRSIAHACAAATDEATVASEALRVLMKGTGAAIGSVVVCDPSRPGFARALVFQRDGQVPVAVEANWRASIATMPIAPDAALTVLRVIATTQPYLGPDVMPSQTESDTMTLQAMTVPLRWDGAVIGALSVQFWPEDVETIDQELVQLAADEVGISLHRARLFEAARQLALIDPLTGLSNHRALQDVVRQELATGSAQSLPVSIIKLDVDHFRQFNEAYGHESGDAALRTVAKAIIGVLRPGDTAARFSGEEFAVVLPATDADLADALAVRMQEAIAGQTLFTDAEGNVVRLTVSAGHATFPLHASAHASLLKAADLALYAAKRGGRNCVVAYTVTLIEDNAHLLPMGIGDSIAHMGEISLPTGADLETVQAFITAIDLRDGYTAAHSDGVSRYAVAIAAEMNLPAEYVEALRLGGLVHDVGKIGVSDQVLRKPGKLDAEEWHQMQQHTVMGEAILRPLEQLRQLLPLVRWHHERLDGSGYPDGLRGDEIPMLVRILSVADVFEAFTAERPYHPGRPAIEGVRLLQREAAEGKLDPYVVEVFEGILICQGLVTESVRGEQDLVLAA
ncbi:MAG: diguanylate cyclase [Ktedonobacterales bacterium]|nr:diguanylate cyclase [Ktedonobacterales bacterium]